jgi:hypothetical protein
MRVVLLGLATGGCALVVLVAGAAVRGYRQRLAADARARRFLQHWHDHDRETARIDAWSRSDPRNAPTDIGAGQGTPSIGPQAHDARAKSLLTQRDLFVP